MRLSTTTLAATLFALLSSTGGTQAATSPEAINSVLADCPVETGVGKCVNAVIDFANGLPASADRNADLLMLAGALAEEALGNRTTPLICQELELSIRTAGQAAVGAATQSAITAIADKLCVADVDYTTTGSTGSAGGGGYTPPESLVEQDDHDNNGTPPDSPPDTPPAPPPVEEEEPVDLLPDEPIFEDG
jgi:hypothetical protein